MRQGKRLGLAAVAATLMALAGAPNASGTMLEVGGTTQDQEITLTTSLASGSSLVLKQTNGSFVNTCTSSHTHGSTEFAYFNSNVSGFVTHLLFSACSEGNIVVEKAGRFSIEYIPGTTNGTVRSIDAQVKVPSPFGTLTCRTEAGSGTDIGVLTGTGDVMKHATLDINMALGCGLLGGSVIWQGTYTITSPTGLGVTDPPTALEVGGSTKNESVEITGSLAAGSSLALKAFGSLLLSTCTASHLQGATTSPFTDPSPVAMPIETLTFSSCSRESFVVHNPGTLTIQNVPGTTSGTVRWEGAELTVLSNAGPLTCKIGPDSPTDIGTLIGTGKVTEHATLQINASVDCGLGPSTVLQGTYTITSPTGLGVTS